MPDGGETMILAVEVLAGTVTRIVLLLEMVKSEAFTLPKAIAEIAVKFVPFKTTLVLGPPLVGEKLVSCAWAKKFVAVEI